MKIIFFGTPAVAARFLNELILAENVAGVVSRPDRPRGRGLELQPPATKALAVQHGITVFQPEKFTPEDVARIESLKPDVGIVVSYGKLIPRDVFSIPAFGCFNIHFSLLPAYRGAAPMQWALINGETKTGVTAFWLEETLDSGPVLVGQECAITPSDDIFTLEEKLVTLGIGVMRRALECIKQGACAGKTQSGTPSFAPSLKKETGDIDWSLSAERIINLIRGTKAWPGAYSKLATGRWAGKTIKIRNARIYETAGRHQPGEIIAVVKNEGFAVACGAGALLVDEVHPESKKPMPAWPFLQGGAITSGDKFAII